MTQKFHSCNSKDTLLAVDYQGGIAEPLEKDPKMLQMLLLRAAGDDDVIQVYKDEVQPAEYPVQSMYLWKVLPAFLRPKVIRRNSHSPNGVMMAVFGMSAACMWI
jgi:hypothetical protein